ncbi:hypothetical protein B0H67DRAFT_136148 [Lasiosphaeris hirsuta]|uniref:Uncharacterized protein n=1 Tax=Lasiosphaeris hirsuta TaxID=260670 RepID=A0AA40E3E1_9PEZI|nr:hypothetical protein B0H67DRAFT_136148 [Lasiosphaeris hirsuta]
MASFLKALIFSRILGQYSPVLAGRGTSRPLFSGAYAKMYYMKPWLVYLAVNGVACQAQGDSPPSLLIARLCQKHCTLECCGLQLLDCIACLLVLASARTSFFIDYSVGFCGQDRAMGNGDGFCGVAGQDFPGLQQLSRCGPKGTS